MKSGNSDNNYEKADLRDIQYRTTMLDQDIAWQEERLKHLIVESQALITPLRKGVITENQMIALEKYAESKFIEQWTNISKNVARIKNTLQTIDINSFKVNPNDERPIELMAQFGERINHVEKSLQAYGPVFLKDCEEAETEFEHQKEEKMTAKSYQGFSEKLKYQIQAEEQKQFAMLNSIIGAENIISKLVKENNKFEPLKLNLDYMKQLLTDKKTDQKEKVTEAKKSLNSLYVFITNTPEKYNITVAEKKAKKVAALLSQLDTFFGASIKEIQKSEAEVTKLIKLSRKKNPDSKSILYGTTHSPQQSRTSFTFDNKEPVRKEAMAKPIAMAKPSDGSPKQSNPLSSTDIKILAALSATNSTPSNSSTSRSSTPVNTTGTTFEHAKAIINSLQDSSIDHPEYDEKLTDADRTTFLKAAELLQKIQVAEEKLDSPSSTMLANAIETDMANLIKSCEVLTQKIRNEGSLAITITVASNANNTPDSTPPSPPSPKRSSH